MFSNVRVNQQIFILDKATGTFEVGTVCEEPKTRFSTAQQSQTYLNPYAQSITVQVVDLKVQTPTGTQTLQGLPMDKNVFDNPSKTLFVTEDKGLMLNELKVLKTLSETHLKQTEYHKDMIVKYDAWIAMLNPEEAEKRRTEQKMDSLEKALEQQTEINKQIMEQLQMLSKQNEMLMNRGDSEKNVKPKNKE